MRVMVTVCVGANEAQAIKEIIAMRLEEIGRTRIVSVSQPLVGKRSLLKITASVDALDELAGVVKEIFREDTERGFVAEIETEADGYGVQESIFDR